MHLQLLVLNITLSIMQIHNTQSFIKCVTA